MEQLKSPLSHWGTWGLVRAALWFCTRSVNHRNCFWRKSSASPCSNDSKLGSINWLWPLTSHNKFQEDLGKHSAVPITDNREHFTEVPMAPSSQTAPPDRPGRTVPAPRRRSQCRLRGSCFHHFRAPWESKGFHPHQLV